MTLVNWIGNRSLHTRLIIYFVIVAIVPILIVGFVSYTLSMKIIKERAMQFSQQMVDQVAGEIDNLLLDTYKVSTMVAEDHTIQQVLRQPMETNISKRYSTDLTLDTRLTYIQSSYRNEFFGFYVLADNGGKYKSNFYTVKNYDLRSSDWYLKIINSKDPVWFGTHVGSFAVETVDELLVSVGFPIIDKASGKNSGVVVIDIEEALLSEITDSLIGKTGYMMILDANNQVISHPDKSMISKEIQINDINSRETLKNFDLPFISKSKTDGSIVAVKTSEVNGWQIVGVLPVRELIKDGRQFGMIITGMVILICCLALLVAWVIAGSVANPLKKLMLLMKKVEAGDLSVTMKVKYNDEVGQLGKSFNLMVENIAKLMTKVYEEQHELRKAELKTLQAQINPHFLYNTLDSIIWLSRAKRNEDVDKMVTALTKLFRIGISRGKDIISIREEFEHVANYLTIQNIRYKNKFTYDIQLPEELAHYQTLKLILQPIVENAIYHGIKMKKEVGRLTIRAIDADDMIIFEVSDTGKGMTKEQLIALENTLKGMKENIIQSYGVKNVNERLKIFFGPQYGLNFMSEYGVGTTVTIKIPKLAEVNENVESDLG